MLYNQILCEPSISFNRNSPVITLYLFRVFRFLFFFLEDIQKECSLLGRHTTIKPRPQDFFLRKWEGKIPGDELEKGGNFIYPMMLRG